MSEARSRHRLPIPLPPVEKRKLLPAVATLLSCAESRPEKLAVDGASLLPVAIRQALVDNVPAHGKHVHYCASFKHKRFSTSVYETAWLLRRSTFMTSSTLPLQVVRNGSNVYPALDKHQRANLLADWFCLSVQNSVTLANRLAKKEALVQGGHWWMEFGLENEMPLSINVLCTHLAQRFAEEAPEVLAEAVEVFTTAPKGCDELALADAGQTGKTCSVRAARLALAAAADTKLLLNPPMVSQGVFSGTPDLMLLERKSSRHLHVHLFELKTASSVSSEDEALAAIESGKTVLGRNLRLNRRTNQLSMKANSPAYAQVLVCEAIIKRLHRSRDKDLSLLWSAFFDCRQPFETLTVTSSVVVSLGRNDGPGRPVSRRRGPAGSAVLFTDFVDARFAIFHDPSLHLPDFIGDQMDDCHFLQGCLSAVKDELTNWENDWPEVIRNAVQDLDLPADDLPNGPSSPLAGGIFVHLPQHSAPHL